MVSKIPSMVDMKLDAEEQEEAMNPSPPAYPYGLCISLCDDELEKLGLDDNVNVGDMLHMHCLAEVTSVSKRDDSNNGPSCRIELQIKFIAAEDEDEENEEEDKYERTTSKLYTNKG